MRSSLAAISAPLIALAIVAGAYVSREGVPSEAGARDSNPKRESLVTEAFARLEEAELRHQRRFSEALDPEAAEAALQERLSLAVDAGIEEEIVRAGHELFVRDRALKRRRKPAVEANRCAACHSRLGIGGAGGLVDNFFDGRNPPALWGGKLLERLAAEMSDELRTDRAAGRALHAKGISFGSASEPEGVRSDLRIRPFGRGRWATLDETVGHMGEKALGIELSPNERLALSAWISTLPAPALEPPDASRTPDLYEAFLKGRRHFRDLGCATCHVPELSLADGTQVAAYTDLKLHDLGRELTPGPDRLLTAPLWGLSGTAPWLHDGRALASLESAIVAHGGEAESVRSKYVDLKAHEKGELHTFLLSLSPKPKLQIAGQ